MKRLVLSLMLTSAAFADPTPVTVDPEPIELAPTDPPVVAVVGQVADNSRPAYVPAFARNSSAPARLDERAYAYRNTYPTPLLYPTYLYPTYFGYPLYRRYGYVANHGFYR